MQVPHVRAVGSDTLIEWIKTKLGIAPGESTADGLFSLSVVECLAACGTGPMMQINEDYYEQLTEHKLDRILADLRSTGTSPLKSGPFMWPERNRLTGKQADRLTFGACQLAACSRVSE